MKITVKKFVLQNTKMCENSHTTTTTTPLTPGSRLDEFSRVIAKLFFFESHTKVVSCEIFLWYYLHWSTFAGIKMVLKKSCLALWLTHFCHTILFSVVKNQAGLPRNTPNKIFQLLQKICQIGFCEKWNFREKVAKTVFFSGICDLWIFVWVVSVVVWKLSGDLNTKSINLRDIQH